MYSVSYLTQEWKQETPVMLSAEVASTASIRRRTYMAGTQTGTTAMINMVLKR